MTDNVSITAGSGTVIATDDVGGSHYQRVKLVDGTADSTSAIPGDSTNGLDVDVTRIGAGETHVGEVGGHMTTVSGEFTRPSNTIQYSVGDTISNSTVSTTLLEIQNVARANGSSGYITSIQVVTNKKNLADRVRVHLCNASDVTVSVDNTPHRELYADVSKRIDWLDLPAMISPADQTNSDMSKTRDSTIRIPFTCAGGTRSIWIELEALTRLVPISGQKFTVILSADNN